MGVFWSTACLENYFKWLIFHWVCRTWTTLFKIHRSRAQFVPNVTTLTHTLWCKDACSVYNATTSKCRVVLSSWSVFKGHKEQAHLSWFCTSFFSWNATRRLRDPTTAFCRRCWEDEGEAFQVEGEVEGRLWDKWNVLNRFRLSHWQSRKTGGSGVVARCQRAPYWHLETKDKQNKINKRID